MAAKTLQNHTKAAAAASAASSGIFLYSGTRIFGKKILFSNAIFLPLAMGNIFPHLDTPQQCLLAKEVVQIAKVFP